MLAKLRTYTLLGIEALPVEVEVDVSASALPKTVLVGLPEAAVKESAALLRRTWGENLAGQAGLGSAFALLNFLLIALGVMLAISFAVNGSAILTVLTLLLTLGALLLSFLVHGALSGIYAAALYRFATQSGDTAGFDQQALRNAFVPKAGEPAPSPVHWSPPRRVARASLP